MLVWERGTGLLPLKEVRIGLRAVNQGYDSLGKMGDREPLHALSRKFAYGLVP